MRQGAKFFFFFLLKERWHVSVGFPSAHFAGVTIIQNLVFAFPMIFLQTFLEGLRWVLEKIPRCHRSQAQASWVSCDALTTSLTVCCSLKPFVME